MMPLLFTLLFAKLPAPIVSLDDSHPHIGFPFDAFYHQGILYLTDQYHHFYSLKAGERKELGIKGGGPKEFQHHPELIDMIGNELVVTEMYGWSRSFFTPQGTFLRKEDAPRNEVNPDGSYVLQIGDKSIEVSGRTEALKQGFLYRDVATGVFFGTVQGGTQKDYHLNAAFLFARPGGLWVLKRTGVFQKIDGGRSIGGFAINLRRHEADVTPDKLQNWMKKPKGHVFYLHGRPIQDAVFTNTHAYLLVADEHKVVNYNRYKETWLYAVDLAKQKVVNSGALGGSFRRIRISGTHLVLVSDWDAMVRVYRLGDFG